MKKLIPLIAIALAMALPATMIATEVEWDFTVETPPLEIIEQNIIDGHITFTTDVDRTNFLNGIQEVYNARDAENYSLCATLANDLTTTAVQTITDTIVGNNVSVVCGAVADEYSEWPENMLYPSIDSEDIGKIDDGTGQEENPPLFHFEIIPKHFPGCLERRRGHVGDCRIRRQWIIDF
ncbi:hypothetical protein KAX06_08580 [candidate division WOR-3 bacterium]|nr:hypothetical protein [candidate division WOR-3 bacterium]MCK4334818.1 hypothetical protein [candidate division WOR-3 bacterium]